MEIHQAVLEAQKHIDSTNDQTRQEGRLMKIIILSSRVAAASLEAFITNKRRLPSVIHMQL